MLSSVRLNLLLVCLLPALLCTSNAIAEQPWIEVRSPHFRVLTNGSAKDGRTVANEFEQMRYVLSLRFNDGDIQSGPPLTVIAARDESTFRNLDAASWKAMNGNIAGQFFRGWEKQFAIIRLDTWTNSNQVVVYHEYTHSVLHARAHWLPIWLDEGLAEFYAYTRFEKDRIYIGAPSLRMRALQGVSLIPVSTMLEVNYTSPYYHDEAKTQVFYAEAWAMVHYMLFAPGMENGKKLNRFFEMLQRGVNQQKGFQDVFGDPKAFDTAFSQYLSHFTFSAGVLPPDRGTDPKSFPERLLTPAEVDYELGCFHIGAHDRVAGRTLIEKALVLDPNLAAAHEELGFLDFDAGQDGDAEAQWKQAIALDPSLPRSIFALTMTSPVSGAPFVHQSADQLRATQLTLQHVSQLAPRFAPVYTELALLEWQSGHIQQAYKDARQAEDLEPWRAGYHVLTGRILLHGKQAAIADEYSRYVATHWFGPDHNEAVDLWQAIPTSLRGEGPPLTLDMPPGVEIARGRLLDVSCSKQPGENKLSVTLIPDKATDGKSLTFTSDGRLRIGFSDTLWWGEDHFSACHHLAGHPAVLAYKPQGAQGGELVDLEVRDDLPDSQ